MSRRLTLVCSITLLLVLDACGFNGGMSVLIVDKDGYSAFKAVRFNEEGLRDTALDSSLSISVSATGPQTTVDISVADVERMYGVAMELEYDESVLTPKDVEFGGLIETPLELAVLSQPGLVALAQVDAGGKRRRSGFFASITFENQAAPAVRTTSATYSDLVDFTYGPAQLTESRSGFEVTKSTAEDESPALYTIYSTFAAGDGDDNSETNVGDITPMVAQGNFNVGVSDSNFGPAATDYDRNGEVNIADLVPIALNINRVLSGVEILLGDTDTLGSADTSVTLEFADGTPAQRSGNPFTTADWTQVWRTWNGEVALSEMEAVDADEDGTVYISARLTEISAPGAAFSGLPLTYDAGPGDVTSISLDFPGSDTWPQDGDNNYIVLLTELSVDGIEGNTEDFAPESLGLTATVDTTRNTGIDGTGLVVWSLTEGGGLAVVNNTNNKGNLTFVNRGKITVEANAPGNFAVNDSISFVLLSIQELTMELETGGTGPETVTAGTQVQFVVTGTFDWDGVENGNEVDEDLTLYCNWGQLPDEGNTGTFSMLPGLGALGTGGAEAGDSVQVSAEFPKTDNVTLYDNQKRASNFIQVDISS